MTIDFILPDIGEGIVECELVEWLVKEGDIIVEDQPIADVMTDKALVQIPAMHSGTVEKLFYQQGEIAKVHAPLFSMKVASETETKNIEENTEIESDERESTQVNSSQVKNVQAKTPSQTTIEDFILPDIGEGIVECELVEWLVKEGDIIEEDQPIADVMTDKALVQIPAMHSGVIQKLYYQQGEIAKVHAPLFSIEIQGEASAQPVVETVASNAMVKNKNQSTASNQVVAQVSTSESLPSKESKVINAKAVASPAVRRVARELNVNIHEIPGSGKKGRIYKEDVIAFTRQGDKKSSVTNVATSITESLISALGTTTVEPIRGIKAVMAKAMVNSVSTIPHFTYCEEIDMTNLINLRKELKETPLIKELAAKQDVKLTMMPFFMKAMSMALTKFPVINAQVNDDCSEITYFNDHNIGMAVDSKIGLLVPNVKQVQTKSILDLAHDVTRLTNDARSGRVKSADLKGGTITISNIGAIGGTIATPIINKPEAAIVALGKLQTLPRFNAQGEVEARSIMQVSWSGDHRIIDGGSIARFCNLWKSYLEDPSNMLIQIS